MFDPFGPSGVLEVHVIHIRGFGEGEITLIGSTVETAVNSPEAGPTRSTICAWAMQAMQSLGEVILVKLEGQIPWFSRRGLADATQAWPRGGMLCVKTAPLTDGILRRERGVNVEGSSGLSNLASAWASWPLAWSSAAWNGRGSSETSDPLLRKAPSL